MLTNPENLAPPLKRRGGPLISDVRHNKMDKKDKEKSILENYKKNLNGNFEILELNQAKEIFPSYTGENPDFIIKVKDKFIGVELFRLCLNKSKVDLSIDGNKFTNQMHKNSAYLKSFNSIEKAQELLKTCPEAFSPTRQDDSGDLIREGIKHKIPKSKNYITTKNWLIAYADEDFNQGVVDNIFQDGEQKSYESFVKQIISSVPDIEKVILFEPNSKKQKIFEIINSIQQTSSAFGETGR